MAEEPVFTPVALCEVCWLIDHTNWEPESMNEEGQIVMRLTGVDVPEKINNDSVEICAICGSITVSGIYEIRDKSTVNFLDNDDEFESGVLDDDPTAFILSMNDFDNMEDDL